MRTTTIYHKDGTKTTLTDKPYIKESYESRAGFGKDFHQHHLECCKHAESAGEYKNVSHAECQRRKDIHTWAQQPGWWKKQ